MTVPLQAALDRLTRDPFHPGAALSVFGPGGEAHYSSGSLTVDQPCFFASATKLLIATVLHQMAEEGLDLDAPFSALVPLAGLLVRDGQDLTASITIRHLMAHVSGLPDYLGSADPKRGLMGALLRGEDRGWSRDQALDMARGLPPVGRPGQMRRGFYSDTNYQLLDAVIEAVDGAPVAEVLAQRIIRPLGLTQTWLYSDPADARPALLRYRAGPLHLPQAMASFRGDGGLVTTTREGLIFLQALWAGRFGPTDWLTRGPFRRVFFPVDYGEGVMRFALPRWMTLFRRFPALYGHSGHSGAVLFHAPETGTSIAATVNQIDRPGAVFKLMLKAL